MLSDAVRDSQGGVDRVEGGCEDGISPWCKVLEEGDDRGQGWLGTSHWTLEKVSISCS